MSRSLDKEFVLNSILQGLLCTILHVITEITLRNDHLLCTETYHASYRIASHLKHYYVDFSGQKYLSQCNYDKNEQGISPKFIRICKKKNTKESLLKMEHTIFFICFVLVSDTSRSDVTVMLISSQYYINEFLMLVPYREAHMS